MLNSLLLCGLMLATSALAADLHEGTWKIDVGKSHYTDHPAPQSETVTTTHDATSFHVRFDVTISDGKSMNAEISFPLKGGPLTEKGFPPDPKMDHGSVKVVGKKWIMSYFDKDNKLTSRRVVTSDNKVSEAKLYTADGKLLEDEVADKQ